jgi:rubrerythrin
MREGTPATQEIADEITAADRAAADELLTTLDPQLGPISMSERLAWGLARARAAQLAEIERASDTAHLAGYAEGSQAAYAAMRSRIIEGNGSHDCAPCNDTGALRDGSACPLCDGFGKL